MVSSIVASQTLCSVVFDITEYLVRAGRGVESCTALLLDSLQPVWTGLAFLETCFRSAGSVVLEWRGYSALVSSRNKCQRFQNTYEVQLRDLLPPTGRRGRKVYACQQL